MTRQAMERLRGHAPAVTLTGGVNSLRADMRFELVSANVALMAELELLALDLPVDWLAATLQLQQSQSRGSQTPPSPCVSRESLAD